ncbi:MAG: ArsR family transcriptional regulator [Anaerolineae bacterium]|nr:ArsR family transcriptional regulator [Anaerolineae bacterium]
MDNHRPFKQAIHEQFARIAKAIANPHRLELIDVLAQGERSVEELANETALSIANASQHLQALRDAHLVIPRKVGLRVYYRLADMTVFQLVQQIRSIAEQQLAEMNRIVDTYLGNRALLEPITANELSARLYDASLVILDVRPHLEYKQGHILGARSIPVDELENRLSELPKEQEIVAYCRGRYCVFADEAIEILNKHGYRSRRIDVGFPDWQLANLPIEIPKGGSDS